MANQRGTETPMEYYSEDHNHNQNQWIYIQKINSQLIRFFKLVNEKCGIQKRKFKSDDVSQIQAIKLLVLEFLSHHDLLFTLLTFGLEVPKVQTIVEYFQYIEQYTQISENSINARKIMFKNEDVTDILQALGFNPTCHLVQRIQSTYTKNKDHVSLFMCVINTLTDVMHKFCYQETELNSLRIKEENLRKVMEKQKDTIHQFEVKFEDYENMLSNYKEYVHKKILERELHLNKLNGDLEQKQADLLKQETDLQERNNQLIAKEKSWEERKETEIADIRKTGIQIKSRLEDIQNIKHRLLNEEVSLKKREYVLLHAEDKISDSVKKELAKKYEQKLSKLQKQMSKIQERLNIDSKSPKDTSANLSSDKFTQCTKQISDSQENLTGLLILQRELKLEKARQKCLENELERMKTILENRHVCTNEIVTEISYLKNSLQTLNKEVSSLKNISEKQFTISQKMLSDNDNKIPKFENDLFKKSLEISSTSNSKDSSSLTDDIVSDAKQKLKQLEKESEILNRNFQNLQNILSKNSMFDVERNDFTGLGRSYWETRSLPSPRNNFYSKENFSDYDQYSDKNFLLDRYQRSCFSLDRSPFLKGRKLSPFRQLFLKHRRQKLESIYSSTDSLANSTNSCLLKKPKCAKKLFDKKFLSRSSDSLIENERIDVRNNNEELIIESTCDLKNVADESIRSSETKNLNRPQDSESEKILEKGQVSSVQEEYT